MRHSRQKLVILLVIGLGICVSHARGFEIETSAKSVGKYQRLEMTIWVDTQYANPFDPDEVDLTVLLKSPSGKNIVVPAFFGWDYRRRQPGGSRGRAGWYYPVGAGGWKARFAPCEEGAYTATAKLRDKTGVVLSNEIQFNCTSSSSKGFLRVNPEDPRFLGFTEGDPFFAIGQNVAFVGEGQYVKLAKAEEIFGTLSKNGANFVRVWTSCKDWAMAIEAVKSAWDRSWQRNAPIVAMPVSGPDSRKCIKIGGEVGASLNVSPSHPVALMPNTHYILSGRFRAEGQASLKVEMAHGADVSRFSGGSGGRWTDFSSRFTTGASDFWLGRLTLRKISSGTIWLHNLSLKEADGGVELLWEADVNRPARGYYNQLDCFMLDELVKSAEQNGIYLMLCLITRDLYMKSLSDASSIDYEQAVKDASNLMRYSVARWGYSTSVAAWEYFNEIDPGLPTDRFYDEVGEYLEKIDPYRHLRTTSTWHPSAKDIHHERLDIGQLHHYMRPGTKEDYKDEVAVLIDKTRFLREHGPNKPVLIGEFGLADPKWGLSDDMKRDKEGVHFHNCIWASAFAGSSGTAMFWWWDQLDRQNAYHHYRPLAEFLSDVSFVGLKPINVTITNDRLRAIGYQGKDCAYMWLADSSSIWWNQVVDNQQPTEVRGASVEIEGLNPGVYKVEWWQTYEGTAIENERITLTGGSLRTSVPSFSRDISCKIIR